MSLTPELNQLIYSVVAFVALLFLLAKFAFPPLLKVIDERQEKIKESLDEAENTRQEAARLMEEYKEQLEKAKAEAQKTIEEGRALGEEVKKDITNKAKEQALRITSQTEAEIEVMKNNVMLDISNKIAELSVSISSKILRKNIDKTEHERMIKNSLEELKKITPTEKPVISFVGEKNRANVYTAIELSDGQKKDIKDSINNIFGHDYIIEFKVDSRVEGGLRLKVGHKIYDYSIAGGLDQALQQLVGELK